jgi:Na+-translocating ferredoxin:NAD+ oxidoreductase subunit B
MADQQGKIDRRGFVTDGIRVLGALGFTGAAVFLVGRKGQEEHFVWQIDPDKCIACDRCQSSCVLDTSAVKAVQCFALCGNCDLCTGYLATDGVLDTGAEIELCPTGAINRKFIPPQIGEKRYFEYTIDESLCIGCGKCVLGCRKMNASLYLQIRHDRCVNCNECAIAVACPPQAIRRVPAGSSVLLSQSARQAEDAQKKKLEEEKRGRDAGSTEA